MKMLHTNGKSRGQVLILACATMLILALMLMFSFNLSQAINEKIRLQNHADAQAYSSAVIEARGLNTLAYVNRAIAASMVAQTALHGWMALASQVVATHQAFRDAFYMVAALELALCLICCWPYCVSNCYHCRDAYQAYRIARKHNKEAKSHASDLKGLEGDFNKRVAGFTKGMKGLRLGELGTLLQVGTEVAAEGDMLKKLKAENAPKAEYKSLIAVGGRSMFELQCALEGLPAAVGGCRAGGVQAIADRSKYMAESANAALPAFQKGDSVYLTVIHPNEIPMMNHLQDLQGNEGFEGYYFDIDARIHESNSRKPQKDKQLKNAGAFTGSMFVGVQWRHVGGIGSRSAKIISEGSGGGNGTHKPSAAHSGSHKEMLNCAEDECFINYRGINSEDDDYGQPRVFGATTQKLRDQRDGAAKAYEVNAGGEVTVEFVRGQQTKVRLVPQGTATAVAKGMVYYHQLKDGAKGGWQHAPNMFDPFWRAKLHPFTRTELIATLGMAGDVPGAAVAITAPVEGR